MPHRKINRRMSLGESLRLTEIVAEAKNGRVSVVGDSVTAVGDSVHVRVRSAAVSKVGTVEEIGLSSGCIRGSCSNDVCVASGETLEICGSMSGNAQIGDEGTLVCRGSCSGNVRIGRGAYFCCRGSMSGAIVNCGGSFEIRGSFSGGVTNAAGRSGLPTTAVAVRPKL